MHAWLRSGQVRHDCTDGVLRRRLDRADAVVGVGRAARRLHTPLAPAPRGGGAGGAGQRAVEVDRAMKSVTIFVIEECFEGGGSRDRENPGIEERPFDTPDSYAAMIKAAKEWFKV